MADDPLVMPCGCGPLEPCTAHREPAGGGAMAAADDEPVFDITGTGIGPYPIREFTSDTGTYVIRYAPRYGVIIWTDRDYGPAASRVLEWLCSSCRTLHPWQEGHRLTRPCPRCGSAMIPTSPAVRALEDARAEIDGLRAKAAAIAVLCGEDAPSVAVDRIEAILRDGEEASARARVTLDLNVRVRKHETYSGFEDVTGPDPASLRFGDRVLAVEVEDGICSDAFVTGVDPERQLVYLAPDWHGWRDATPFTATCTGPDCGEQFTDSETGEYEFAARGRMVKLLRADGWQEDPVLCPACQPEEKP